MFANNGQSKLNEHNTPHKPSNLPYSVACGASLPFALWIGTNTTLIVLKSLYIASQLNIITVI